MPATRVKVVHLITLLEFGGAQGNTIFTVEHLDRNRFEAYLWSGKGAYWDEGVSKGIDAAHLRFLRFLVRPVNPLFDLFAIIEIWSLLRKLSPDVLHTHSSKAGIVGRIAGWLAGVRVVVHTFHGFGFNDQQKPWTRGLFVTLERLTARFSDALIFVSESNKRTAAALRIGRPEKYRLIRSGVDLEQIRRDAAQVDRPVFRRANGIPEAVPLVLTIGAFKPQKNLRDFLSSAQLIRKAFPDTQFVILGDGELRPSLEAAARELGLSDCVRMPGWKQNAAQYIAAADVFVMTSLWEGLPRALVEAMALGVPSVCYDTDGVRDLLTVEEGTLIPQSDAQKLASQVIDLIRDRSRAERVAHEQQRRVGKEFDICEMVRQQEALYSALLAPQ